jgi:hypothetical protein
LLKPLSALESLEQSEKDFNNGNEKKEKNNDEDVKQLLLSLRPLNKRIRN